jgi:hypothetical protein
VSNAIVLKGQLSEEEIEARDAIEEEERLAAIAAREKVAAEKAAKETEDKK